MRKAVALAVLCMVLLVTACSGGSGAGKEVTLRFMSWGQEPIMQGIVDAFEEENPNINIELEVVPWGNYWVNLETAATGGTLPDVFWINPSNFMFYALHDKLLSLQKFADDSKFDTSHFPKAMVDTYTFNGELYGVPKDYGAVGLWYNKELFDAANLDYPDETWTWDDLIENAKKLTDPDKGIYGVSAYINRGIYGNLAFQAGGYTYSPDGTKAGHGEAEYIEAMKFWTGLIHEHKVSPTLAQLEDTPPIAMFESGKVAMHYDGSWVQAQLAKNEEISDKIEVAPMPAGPAGKATLTNGLGYVGAHNTKHPEEAWKFLEFLGSKKANEIQAAEVIPAYIGTESIFIEKNPKFNLQVFVDDAINHGVGFPINIEGSKSQQVETELYTKAFTGEMTVEEASAEIAKRLQAIIDDETERFRK